MLPESSTVITMLVGGVAVRAGYCDTAYWAPASPATSISAAAAAEAVPVVQVLCIEFSGRAEPAAQQLHCVIGFKTDHGVLVQPVAVRCDVRNKGFVVVRDRTARRIRTRAHDPELF